MDIVEIAKLIQDDFIKFVCTTVKAESKNYLLGFIYGKGVQDNDNKTITFELLNEIYVLYGPAFFYILNKFEESCDNVVNHLRGICDACGIIDSQGPSLTFCFEKIDFKRDFLKRAVDTIAIPYKTLSNGDISFIGTNCIDFLGVVYNSSTKPFSANHELYIDLLINSLSKRLSTLPQCKIVTALPDAVVPFKTRESDVGYDITIVKRLKDLTSNVVIYDTGIKVVIPQGMYAEIVPRSSLSKSGYTLANNIGIIDRSYTGNILVPLLKVNNDAPEIKLPFRCCQMIFRQQIHVQMNIVANVEETSRGEGGFGST